MSPHTHPVLRLALSLVSILLLAAAPRLAAQSCPPTTAVCATSVQGTQGSIYLNTNSEPGAMILMQPATGATNKNILFRLGGSDAATSLSVQNSSTTDLFRVTGDGKIGVGTLVPKASFHLVGNSDEQLLVARMGQTGLVGIGTSQLNNSYITFDASYTNGWTAPAGSHTAAMLYKLSDHFQIRTWYDSTAGPIASAYLAPVFDVDLKTGAIGIGAGKVATQGVLDVGGNIHADGNVTAAGTIFASYSQDLAEWVPTETDLSAGTVVVLDKRQRNHVSASSTPYDTSVAGVVSGKPGIILGQRRGTMAAVATTGRVPVQVDATRHPIAIGDLLVTSEMPGVAMKSEPMALNGRTFHQPGTIIGKALEPLSSGTGTILVLLSLQ